MKLSDILDICQSDVNVTLWLKEFIFDYVYRTDFKANYFYSYNSFKFYENSHNEESAIFIDRKELDKFTICSVYPSGTGSLEIILK